MSGPIPNRSENLARPRERKGGNQQSVTKGVMRDVTIPQADPNWHPIATMLWNGCLDSGQADFYQSSDYALLYSLCEDLSNYKSYTKRSGQMLQTIYSTMGSLLVTEGDRRRVRIELCEPQSETKLASVSAIEDARRSLGVTE